MADRMLVAFGKYLKILRDRRKLSLSDVVTLTNKSTNAAVAAARDLATDASTVVVAHYARPIPAKCVSRGSASSSTGTATVFSTPARRQLVLMRKGTTASMPCRPGDTAWSFSTTSCGNRTSSQHRASFCRRAERSKPTFT